MLVKFKEDGIEYAYNRENIKIIPTIKKLFDVSDNKHDFITYTYETECYRCKKTTRIFTYIVFADDTNESAVFPWDKPRFLKSQDIIAHMMNPSIEYYGVYVVGSIYEFDKILMEKYLDRIAVKYSNVVKKSYPMNLCEHCNAPQGKYYVY